MYSQEEYCKQEIRRIRDVWGSKDFTRDKAEAVRNSLGFMLFYCPPVLTPTVDAMLMELDMRESWLPGGVRSELHKLKQALGLAPVLTRPE